MRPRQTLLLGLLLLVPVLAFLFLYRFGSNRYALPTYLPSHVDSTLVGSKWQRDTVFHQIGAFQRPSAAGRLVASQELFTGLCVVQFLVPTEVTSQRVAQNLMQVQEKFRHEPLMRLATLVMTQPAPATSLLGHLGEQYGAIAGKWYFLGGTFAESLSLANDEFRATEPVGSALAVKQPKTQLLFLVDRNRRVRGIYDGTKPRDIDRLMTEINVQLYDYAHPH